MATSWLVYLVFGVDELSRLKDLNQQILETLSLGNDTDDGDYTEGDRYARNDHRRYRYSKDRKFRSKEDKYASEESRDGVHHHQGDFDKGYGYGNPHGSETDHYELSEATSSHYRSSHALSDETSRPTSPFSPGFPGYFRSLSSPSSAPSPSPLSQWRRNWEQAEAWTMRDVREEAGSNDRGTTSEEEEEDENKYMNHYRSSPSEEGQDSKPQSPYPYSGFAYSKERENESGRESEYGSDGRFDSHRQHVSYPEQGSPEYGSDSSSEASDGRFQSGIERDPRASESASEGWHERGPAGEKFSDNSTDDTDGEERYQPYGEVDRLSSDDRSSRRSPNGQRSSGEMTFDGQKEVQPKIYNSKKHVYDSKATGIIRRPQNMGDYGHLSESSDTNSDTGELGGAVDTSADDDRDEIADVYHDQDEEDDDNDDDSPDDIDGENDQEGNQDDVLFVTKHVLTLNKILKG